MRQDASVDWGEIGAKVKKLLDDRIDAEVRELMAPVSILDKDFEQKIAHLPHEEARASVMEHAIRAQIKERLSSNPVFYERLSQQLERIIRELRQRLIDAAEASRRMSSIREEIRSESQIAAEQGLTPVSFAVYELLERSPKQADEGLGAPGVADDQGDYRTHLDETLKLAALRIEAVMRPHQSIVDWQSNYDVQRVMRRDIKRELRGVVDLSEEELDELAQEMVEVARRRGAQ